MRIGVLKIAAICDNTTTMLLKRNMKTGVDKVHLCILKRCLAEVTCILFTSGLERKPKGFVKIRSTYCLKGSKNKYFQMKAEKSTNGDKVV